MPNYKSCLYTSAVNTYRTKFADAATVGLDPALFGSVDTLGNTRGNIATPLQAMEPWYKVKWSDPWAFAGAVGMSIPGIQAGYLLSQGLSRHLQLDDNGPASIALKLLGSGLGAVGGAYLGRYAMLPFNAATPLGNWITARTGSKGLGAIGSIGTMLGGSYLYTVLADKLLNTGKQLGINLQKNAPLSPNDAARVIEEYTREYEKRHGHKPY